MPALKTKAQNQSLSGNLSSTTYLSTNLTVPKCMQTTRLGLLNHTEYYASSFVYPIVIPRR